MTVYYSYVPSPDHQMEGHDESPLRFALLAARLPELEAAYGLRRLEVSPARLEEVERVHRPALLQFLPDACARAPAWVDMAPTYVMPGSWDAALLAAGGALAASRAAVSAGAPAFALVRPPGHHASADAASGFCLLNNVAIAALDALASGLRRVAIVDFDAHHGNGTQAVVWDEPRVGFFSSHQEGIYPGSGRLEEGSTRRGRILNLPLPANSGDQAFLRALDRVVIPWLSAFQPELLLVSAGYDGHWQDPLTALGFSSAGYYQIVSALKAAAGEICAGRLVLVLEGGYEPRALADNVISSLAALAGAPPPADRAGSSPHRAPDISTRLERLREIHLSPPDRPGAQ